jgi:hypothetical protein
MGVTVVNTALTASTAVTRARASVVIVAPVAETSAALLAAATSVVLAGASVTVVVPVNNLNYILLASAAYLDTSGRFQYFANEVFVSDASFRVAQKGLTDTFGQTDYITNVDTALGKTDIVSVPDFVIRTLEFIRRFTDTITPVEVLSYTFARPLADAFGTTDSKALNLSRPVASSFSNTDFATTHLTKVNFETLNLADTSRLLTQKGLADSFSHTDSNVKSFTKGLAHSVVTSETFLKTIGRVITDGFAMNDTADLADGVTYQTVKYLTNVVFTSDTSTRAWNANKADSVSLTSSGSLTSQNYCDLSYFAEDYVGQSRTFS